MRSGESQKEAAADAIRRKAVRQEIGYLFGAVLAVALAFLAFKLISSRIRESGELPPLTTIGGNHLGAGRLFLLGLSGDGKLWGEPIGKGYANWIMGVESRGMVVSQGGANWRGIAAGDNASYAITSDGRLLRRAHPLGRNKTELPPEFLPLFPSMRWTKVESAQDTALGLSADGRLYWWSEESLNEGRLSMLHGGDGPTLNLAADGTLHVTTEEESRTRAEQHLDNLEKSIAWETRMFEEHWKAQPGGLSNPAYLKRKSDREQENALRRKQARKHMYLQRRDAVRVSDLRMPVPLVEQGDWIDLCLYDSRDENHTRAYVLDRRGALWRLEGGNHWPGYMDAEPPVLHRATTTVKLSRLYCPLMVAQDGQLHGLPESTDRRVAEEKKQPTARDRDLVLLSREPWIAAAAVGGLTVALSQDGSLWQWGGEPFKGVKDTSVPRQLTERSDWTELTGNRAVALVRNGLGEIYAVNTWGGQASLCAHHRVVPPPPAFKKGVCFE